MKRLAAVLLAAAIAAALLAASRGDQAAAVPSARVTLAARPLVLAPNAPLTLSGQIDSGRDGEIVTIQAKDCGLTTYTGVESATTGARGTFTAEFRPNIGTEVRALWSGATSPPIAIRQQPLVRVVKQAGRTFEVGVSSKGQFWHKRVLFQIRRGGWKTMKSVLLTDTASSPGAPFVYTSAEFRASVPRGTQVRAVLPAAQARPCYLAAVSDTIRA
jgi:hypothetical protein